MSVMSSRDLHARGDVEVGYCVDGISLVGLRE